MLWIPWAMASNFMPPSASAISGSVDTLYGFLLISSLISFIILMGGLCYFLYKYRRKSDQDVTPYITHDNRLEFLWSFIPFVIFMICFFWGVFIYLDMRTFPKEAMEIHVYGKKWDWEFVYKNGHREISDVGENGAKIPPTMVVPLGQPIKLIMTSIALNPNDKMDRAVLHSFFIPAFRVKQDVVPGRYTALTFTPTRKGNFYVFCTEYCGTGHSSMMARVKVVEPVEFDNWVLGVGSQGQPKGMSLAEKGKQIYRTRACIGCHSLDGSPMTGPTWKNLYGSKRVFLDGSFVVADEEYLRNSILNPNGQVVKGYAPNQMPSYQGQLTDEDISAVIQFIKEIKK